MTWTKESNPVDATWEKEANPSTATTYLLKEDGDKLLLETGDKIVLTRGSEWNKLSDY